MDSFTISPELDFQVKETETEPGAIISYTFEEITHTSCRFKVITSEPGTLYVYIAHADRDAPDYETIKEMFGSFNNRQSNMTVGITSSLIREDGETYFAYEHRQYHQHLQNYWIVGTIVGQEKESPVIELTDLWSGTFYQISSYLVVEAAVSKTYIHEFVTSDFILPGLLGLTFLEDVSSTFGTELTEVFADDVFKVDYEFFRYKGKIQD